MKAQCLIGSRYNPVELGALRQTCAVTRRPCRRIITHSRLAAVPLVALILSSLLLSATFSWQHARAQELQPGQPVDPSIMSWPRYYATNGYEFAAYQPQITQWPGNQLEGRFVVAVRPAGTSNETYGVLFFEARTDIDKVNRLVTLEDFQITRLNFPTRKAMEGQYLAMFQSLQKHSAKVIPLDQLETVFAASADVVGARIEQVRNDPPRIIYSTQPSLLILVDGPPILKPLVNNYSRVINTRAILMQCTSPGYQGFYLYADNNWFTAPSLGAPWNVTYEPPSDIDSALSAALATKEVDPMYPKNPNAPAASAIYVSTVPAELIETAGAPNLLGVAGTELLYVQNSSSAIFYYLNDGKYYVLISGRWFKSATLGGGWTFVAPGQLPADFKKIPADSEKSNVLVSVPGTPQAREAAIANSIPQTATIQRDQAKLSVAYINGGPSFSPIAGTSLGYALNTDTPVIMVNPATYYACQGGVWFAATSALGPWAVATSVPPVIYTIPTSCPIHYVTYVYVYGYTPSVVYAGYTPGYAGTVVAPGGVVVYGTGYDYPPVVAGSTYVCYPPTYGYGASFALGAAIGYSFGYSAGSGTTCCCEPYWGCYYWATPYGYSYTHVNVNATSFYTHWGTAVHATSSYGYNAWTGNEWAARSATTYNPYTGARGEAARGGAYNVYSGNYAAGRQAAGYNPSTGAYGAAGRGVTGNAYNGTASGYNRGVVGNTQTGNAVAWNNGNMYADRNGNMYRYNPSTGAQQYNNGSWQTASKAPAYSYNQSSAWQPATTAQSPRYAANWPASSTSSGNAWAASGSWADRAGSAQSVGAQRFDNFRSAGGGGWGGVRAGGGWRR